MPIYEYECQACGDVQEVMQKISDPGPDECAACHKGPMNKIMSRSGFILKGSGWYVTDFKDGGKKPAAKAGGSESGQGTGTAGAAPATGGGDAGGASTTPATSTGSGTGGGGDAGGSKASGGGCASAGCTATHAG